MKFGQPTSRISAYGQLSLSGASPELAQPLYAELALIKYFRDTLFYLEALDESFKKYRYPEIFNNDQRVQFTSKVFVEKLQSNKVVINIDGKGLCHDNIFIEGLWGSLKYEDIY